MNFTHIRHGSHILEFKGKKFLVDPVFAELGTMPSMPKARTKAKNPLIPMPFGFKFVNTLDAVLLTHTHFDHFDDKAIEILPKSLPIICRSHDVKKVSKSGFTNIIAIDKSDVIFNDVHIKTVGGKHGVGLAGMLMGKTTGFILSDASGDASEPKTYIIGDSIWCDEVETTLKKEQPDVIIAFAGAAVLPFGKNITMATGDIHELASASKNAKLIAIHMDTWSHCFLTKDILKDFIKDKTYKNRIMIPNEGDQSILRQSIINLIDSQEDDTIIYLAHGPSS